MAPLHCPACGHSAPHTLEQIHSHHIIDLYQHSLGLDVRAAFDGVPVVRLQQCPVCDLRFYDPQVAGSAEFYEQLQRFDWYYQDDKPEYSCAQQYIRTGDKVLDVGCGKGAFRSFLPPDVDYTGLEFNDKAIQRGRAAGLNIVKQSVQDLAQAAPGSFDVVCSFQVLEHVSDVAGFVDACVALLKPEGRLLLAVPSEDSFLTLDPNGPLNMPPHHVIRWTDQALKQLAARARMQVIQTWHEPVASYHQDWYKDVLARDWFVSAGLLGRGVQSRGVRAKVLDGLMRIRALRDFLAGRRGRQFNHVGRGHTVMLVCQASNAMQGSDERQDQSAA
jgi:2-polyprenyl-3-methyl-5-hydroxy-6-metoxy-1,4-benzoquinol methylase